MTSYDVVALYVGVRGVWPEMSQQVLIEIYRLSSGRHHYLAHDLGGMGGRLEVKTIGSISAPVPGSEEPPVFVCNQFDGFCWRRIR